MTSTVKLDVYRFNLEICEALGLDARQVENINIQFDARRAPTVTVTYLPQHEGFTRLSEVLRQYRLIPK